MVAAGSSGMVGFVTTDATGTFTFTLLTNIALPAGRYSLFVGTTEQAMSEFVINQTAPLRQPNIIGTVITMAKQIYLPIVVK